MRRVRVRVVHRDPAREATAAQRRREWRTEQRARAHAGQVTPMHPAVWWGLGVPGFVALVTLNIAAVPGLVLIGLGVWWYAHRRGARVAANLAREQAAAQTGFEAMAATYERHGMPESARAYRDLADS